MLKMHLTNRALPYWLCGKFSPTCLYQGGGGPRSPKHRRMSIRADSALHVHSLDLSTFYPLEPILPVGPSIALGSPEQIWLFWKKRVNPLSRCVSFCRASPQHWIREAEGRGHTHLWSIITIVVKWLLCAGLYGATDDFRKPPASWRRQGGCRSTSEYQSLNL